MKAIMQAVVTIIVLFGFTACGGGNDVVSKVIDEILDEDKILDEILDKLLDELRDEVLEPAAAPAAPSTDWRHDFSDGSSLSWDGQDFAWSARELSTTPSRVARTDLPNTLSFSGAAHGAIVGDVAPPTPGRVDVSLSGRTMTFFFTFDETQLDPASNPTRRIAGWGWDDSAGAGRFLGEGLRGVIGVEAYNNRAGQRVKAAYLAAKDK